MLIGYPTPRVIDLSHYDDVRDGFKGAVKAGIWGVINKVTEGTGGVDRSFSWRRMPAKKAGLLYGGYHFLKPGRIKEQADHFLKEVGSLDKLLLALDHEDRNVPLKDAQMWMEYVEDNTGQLPVIYSGFLIKEQLGTKKSAFWSKTRLWLSHYSAKPTWPNQVWEMPFLIQYTGDGVGPKPHGVPGILPLTKLDMNHYNYTLETMEREWTK